jgi:hypothetical protein
MEWSTHVRSIAGKLAIGGKVAGCVVRAHSASTGTCRGQKAHHLDKQHALLILCDIISFCS